MKLPSFATLSALLLASATLPMKGASISFTPAGSQIDKDVFMKDISGPPDPLIFTIQLDTLELGAGRLSKLIYEVIFDTHELQLLNSGKGRGAGDENPDKIEGFFDGRDVTTKDNVKPELGKFTVEFDKGDIAGGKAKFFLDELRFKPLRPQDATYLKHGDGEGDFAIRLTSAIFAGVERERDFSRFQEVEVQQAPEPGTWTLLGISLVGIGMMRKRLRVRE